VNINKTALGLRVCLVACVVFLGSDALARKANKPVRELTKIEDVLARYLAVNGGLKEIEKIKSIKIEGIGFEGSASYYFVMIKKRPNLARLIIKSGHTQIHMGYDGRQAWRRVVYRRQDNVTPLEDEDAGEFIAEANFDSLLIQYMADITSLKLEGMEKVGCRYCYKVVQDTDSGEHVEIYLDVFTFQELLHKKVTVVDGVTQESATYFRKIKKIGDIWIAHEMETYVDGVQLSRILIRTVTLGVGVFDMYFNAPVLPVAGQG